jgi:hypothetical protein
MAWRRPRRLTSAALAHGRYLFVAFMVASCVLIRRYHQPGVTKPGPTIIRWLLIVLFSIGAALWVPLALVIGHRV